VFFFRVFFFSFLSQHATRFEKKNEKYN